MLYPKPCYNESCYKEVEVYLFVILVNSYFGLDGRIWVPIASVHCLLVAFTQNDNVRSLTRFVCLISCLTSTVNSLGHVGTVSYPKHTFAGQALP